MPQPVPRFTVPPEVYPAPGVPGAAGFGNDIVNAIIQAAVTPKAQEPRAMVSQVGPAATGEAPRIFPQVRPDPNGTGLIAEPPQAAAGTPAAAGPARPRLLSGKFGDTLSDMAGGFGSFDWRAPPGAAFAQGFAGSIGADRARQERTAAAALAAEERQYQRGRDTRSDVRADRAETRATAAEERARSSAESQALIAATNAAAAYKRLSAPSKLGPAQIAAAFEMGYRVMGLTDPDVIANMTPEQKQEAIKQAHAYAVDSLNSQRSELGPPDLTTETEDVGAGGGVEGLHVTGSGTSRNDPIIGITTEEQLAALPHEVWFLDQDGKLMFNP